ncbi:SDR family NAD(P)-dependent oxidoreductase [Cohnella cholangitidis]|uniref:SDR family NAD(P)-dependent oxidoreductase n=1 Tax=Cohnella cholangitidis TaxID=2598458 RepID=A0A7G5BUX6_9BACL|nr:SDR family NAD(P)-dependent oxidoreductase [Cohnella cholangitidis]QMV40760.1 SDR family NAD(P)-dependent oxidoreductase [Cohnella cholangitidis]
MDKVACVTGTDHGLGLALTSGLLNRGYKVFAGRFETADSEGLSELGKRHAAYLYTVHMDVSQDRSVNEAAKWIGERTDRIDLLINNAARLGDIERTIFDELPYQEMLDVYNVNAIGSLRVTQALLDRVLQSDGKTILNISSEAGSIGNCYRTNWFAYSMSKAALNMQTALLHNQLNPLGVQLLSVHPGWVQTHMQGKLDAAATYTPAQSAAHILELADRPEHYVSDQPSYVDLLGNRLPW